MFTKLWRYSRTVFLEKSLPRVNRHQGKKTHTPSSPITKSAPNQNSVYQNIITANFR